MSQFANDLAEFTYTRTYARWLPEQGRRENWEESVRRVVNFLKEQSFKKIEDSVFDELYDAILNFRILPSMRLMAMAGPAVEKNNIAAYNCAASPIDCFEAFAEMLYILMAGTGVGFSVEERYVNKLPIVKENNDRLAACHYSVEDTTEGWADALLFCIKKAYNCEGVYFSFEKVRPAGTPLKTKGGRSSGPEVLKELLEFTHNTIRGAAGRKLTTLECLDICNKIASIVVVGGVRRSSQISLTDLTDDALKNAKNGSFWEYAPWRAMSNNSAVYESKPSWDVFQNEWQALARSGTGERGIFNRAAAINNAPTRRSNNYEFLTNPSLAAGTLVATNIGIFPIEELDNKQFLVKSLDGTFSPARCFKSGVNVPVMEISFGKHRSVIATPEHKFPILRGDRLIRVPVSELMPGDYIPCNRNEPLNISGDLSLTRDEGFICGTIFGDGWISRRPSGKLAGGITVGKDEGKTSIKILSIVNSLKQHRSNCIEQKDGGESTIQFTSQPFLEMCVNRLGLGRQKDDGIPKIIWKSNDNFIAGFIDGLFSADGCVSANTLILTTSKPKVAKDIAKLLSFYGVTSHISIREATAVFPNGKDYGRFYTTCCVRVSGANIHKFRNLFTITDISKSTKLEQVLPIKRMLRSHNFVKIISICPAKNCDVWDISVAHNDHVFPCQWSYTGNCGEITLRPQQFCNLSEIVARADDTPSSLKEKVRLATIIGTIQSTLTYFPYLRDIWRKNCEEERLLGVSITGQMDCPEFSNNPDLMREMREISIQVNKEYAKKLGVQQSTAITCTKPSGTASLVVDASSGIHPRFAKYYIRRVRISASDPLCSLMKDYGLPMFPEVGESAESARTWVVEFPVKAPDTAVTRHDLTAIQQLEQWLLVQKNWCEHNVSQTIYVGNDEWYTVGSWVYSHWDNITGLSFLPRSDHIYQLAPYEDCSKEEYERRVSEFPEIDYSLLSFYEHEDRTTGSQEYSCIGTKCEI